MKKQIQVPEFKAFHYASVEQQFIVYQELKAGYERSKDLPLIKKQLREAHKLNRLAFKTIKGMEKLVYCSCKTPEPNKFGMDNKCAKCNKLIIPSVNQIKKEAKA